MVTPTLRFSVVALMLGLLGACSKPACEPLTRCDITGRSCQREALRLAQCLRGSDEQVDVDLRVIDTRTYIAEALEEQPELPSEAYLDLRRGLSLFQLSTPYDAEADVQRRADRIAAYYESGEKRITVLDRGATTTMYCSSSTRWCTRCKTARGA